MRWRIVAVGKPRLAYARDGIEEYLSRLRNFGSVEVETVKASTQDKEGKALLEKSEGCFRLVMDERGRMFTSRAFSAELEKIELHPKKPCALIVGGADGLIPAVREKADLVWSLTTGTLQHELALVVALEQIYRACTIKAGLPYHRD